MGRVRKLFTMTTRERFHKVINFEPVDRLPVSEWAPWWSQTLDRWHQEGLPQSLTEYLEICDYFDLDIYAWFQAYAIGPETPPPARKGLPRAHNAEEYRQILPTLYPHPPLLPGGEVIAEEVTKVVESRQSGEAVMRLIVEGYFWHPREVLGIQNHLYAFYDQAELMHEINRNLLAHHLRSVDAFSSICRPDFLIISEDMSYNNGPMISKELFDEFIAPYYRQLVPEMADRGILIIVDSDGNVHDLIPWFDELGVKGVLPLEKHAGVDVARLRHEFPDLRMMGAFDKMVMAKGEAGMRAEFERLLPVMRSGGYIPGVDHQTPPGVSLDDYRLYLTLLREYAAEAAS